MKYLNINTLLIAVLVLILGSGVVSYYFQAKDPYEIPTGMLPVPIQVGKSKSIVSKNGDASMATEIRRRRAAIGSNSCGLNPKFSHMGSTNGSLETYFISGLCPTFSKKPSVVCTSIFDGGNAEDDFCYIVDGNEPYEYIIDGGYADTNVCNS